MDYGYLVLKKYFMLILLQICPHKLVWSGEAEGSLCTNDRSSNCLSLSPLSRYFWKVPSGSHLNMEPRRNITHNVSYCSLPFDGSFRLVTFFWSRFPKKGMRHWTVYNPLSSAKDILMSQKLSKIGFAKESENAFIWYLAGQTQNIKWYLWQACQISLEDWMTIGKGRVAIHFKP